MSRFDYVRYDVKAEAAQAELKATTMLLESTVEHLITSGRAKALVMTKLEEAYMWMGKGIRDDQIARNGMADLQEGRTNS